ncbi:mucin-associated surface protein (MASP), partial [Trypanosoma cruzi]
MLCVASCIRHVERIPDTLICTTRTQLFAWTHVCVLVHAHWSHLVQLFVFCVFTLLLFVYCFLLLIVFCMFFLLINYCGAVCIVFFSCPFNDYNCIMVCLLLPLGCFHLSLCGDCAWCSRRVFLLLLLCVDGELFCAEGYTQVTGVMAMMMTGRVLLACALCVLWCGAGGCFANEAEASANGAASKTTPADKIILNWYELTHEECETDNTKNGTVNVPAMKRCINFAMKGICDTFYNKTP